MACEVRLPRCGHSMSQATTIDIKVLAGRPVAAGQILCLLETDKAAFELASPADGKIVHIFTESGLTLPVDTPLFLICGPQENADPAVIERLQKEFDLLASSLRPEAPVDSPADRQTMFSSQTPLPEAADRPAAVESGRRIPLSRRQHIVAEKMLYSKQHIPCFYLNIRADVTDLVALRRQLDGKYSVNDFIITALARGLKHYPIMTGRLGADSIILAGRIDIGLAIAAGSEVVAPVIPDAGAKTIAQISDCCRDLAARARENTLTVDDLCGGCITVSNLGGFGIYSFIPIVVPGQCSILGVGQILEAAEPNGPGSVHIRSRMNLNLSVDHRIVNGADAAQFLDFVKKQLEHSRGLLES